MTINVKWWALLYSKTQKAWHIEPIEEVIKRNESEIIGKVPFTDYKIIQMAPDYDYLRAYIAKLIKIREAINDREK